MAGQQDGPIDPIGSDLLRDDSTLEQIVTAFVDGMGDRLAAMEEAVRQSDFDTLRVAAHQLKGSGGGYGYSVLTDRAAELEKLARDKSVGGCLEAFDELKQLCARIVAEPSE